MKKSVLIPFDKNGNMMNFAFEAPGVIAPAGQFGPMAWKPNYEFMDTIEYQEMERGRSALNATFVSKNDKKEYWTTGKDWVYCYDE